MSADTLKTSEKQKDVSQWTHEPFGKIILISHLHFLPLRLIGQSVPAHGI